MCSCLKFIIKYVLVIANLLFVLAGIALVVLGALLLANLPSDLDLSVFEALSIVVISVGSIILVVAFFGCCGAARESKCMLFMYCAFMVILIGIKIWLATVIFINLNDLENWVNDWVNEIFQMNFNAFEIVEIAFLCCGTTGYNSYLSTGRPIPDTCCWGTSCTVENSYQGCTNVVSDYFESFGSIVATVILVIIAVEVLVVVFAMYIACYPRNNKSKNVY